MTKKGYTDAKYLGIACIFAGLFFIFASKYSTDKYLFITTGVFVLFLGVVILLPEKRNSDDNSFPIIQLYSPYSWHEAQAILMNESGRKKLVEALTLGEKKLVLQPFVSDGEGYNLYVQILPDAEIDKYQSPYTEDMCRGLDKELNKKEPRYPVTTEEYKLIKEGKDAGEWVVIS